MTWNAHGLCSLLSHSQESSKAQAVLMLVCLASTQVCCASARAGSSEDGTQDQRRDTIRPGSAQDRALLNMDLEQLQGFDMPICHFQNHGGVGGMVVIDNDEALINHTNCPDGVTPELDFTERRVVVLPIDSDTRVLGFERRQEDGAIVIHTRYHYYRRGMMAAVEHRAFFVPPEGTVEHRRHVVTEPSRGPRYVP